MLISCPECQLQVSDRAWSCPHCGYPLKEEPPKLKRSSRRKRLPNGFGQISEIKGRNLRKPFRVLVTIGKNEFGKPICKPLKPNSYFKTYNEAYMALVEYNKNPYDLSKDITLSELFDHWIKTEAAEPSNKIWTSAWKYCSTLYSMRVRDFRARHLKQCLEDGCIIFNEAPKHMSPNIKSYVKSMFNLMFDYAVEYEITDRNYARDFNITKLTKEKEANRTPHVPYTDDEIQLLWDNLDNYAVADMVLIQCYSGWRPQELCNLEVSNVDLINMTFTGGMKTEAGTNRTVPIHSKIYPLVKARYDNAVSRGSKYLFNNKQWVNISRFKYPYNKMITELGLAHRPHDGRSTFVTNAKKYNVDEYAIKYMVGHSIRDITERIYTERSDDWLKSEIEKIK